MTTMPAFLQLPPFLGRVQSVDSGCFIFTGARNQDGYGLVARKTYGEQRAHRLAYIREIGPIPEGLTLDHLCRNRPCVNPAHMEPVLPVENTRRGLVGWLNNPNAQKTQCKNGHAFTPENTRVWGRGKNRQRKCLACITNRREAMTTTYNTRLHKAGPRADCPADACRWHGVEQLPASELHSLKCRIDLWRRQLTEIVEDIELVRKHYADSGVMRTQRGGWVTVASLLPDAELLDVLVNGGKPIFYDTDRELDQLHESGSVSDALGVVSAAYLQQREAGAA